MNKKTNTKHRFKIPKTPKSVNCDYCGGKARILTFKEVYGFGCEDKFFYYCSNHHEPCYVGCHPNSKVPLGCLANKELRKAKMETHNKYFDPLWKCGGFSRKEAYSYLADKMHVPVKKCHIGMFSVQQCIQAQAICSLYNLQTEMILKLDQIGIKNEKEIISFLKVKLEINHKFNKLRDLEKKICLQVTNFCSQYLTDLEKGYEYEQQEKSSNRYSHCYICDL